MVGLFPSVPIQQGDPPFFLRCGPLVSDNAEQLISFFLKLFDTTKLFDLSKSLLLVRRPFQAEEETELFVEFSKSCLGKHPAHAFAWWDV